MRTVALCVLAALLTAPAVGAARMDSPAETKRVVRAWSDRLNAYDNAAVARLFAPPAVFVQGGSVLRLETRADIALWHRLLPCAGRIVSITVKGEYATAVFVLANGKHRRCDARRREGGRDLPGAQREDRELGADPGAEAGPKARTEAAHSGA